MVLLEHVCVLMWSITARVCAGYGLLQHVCVLMWSIIARACADVVNYSTCVLSWSITVTARGCSIKLLYTTV